jgi:cobalamin biosynthesis protein CobT
MEFDPAKVVEELVAKMVKEAPCGTYRPFTTAYDKVHTAKDEAEKYAPSESYGEDMRHAAKTRPNRYEQRLADVSGNINVVRRKLERSLMAKMNRAWTGGHLVGRLDPKRLVPAFNAEANVYKNREPAPELDTAVEILVDLSGSMGGSKAQLAANVCVVLSEVLRKSGIPFEVTGFHNTSSPLVTEGGKRVRIGPYALQDRHPGFDRYESLDLLVFKAFDDRFQEAKVHIANLDCMVGANNSDSEALLMVLPRLEARHERRKVLLVLSDGLPEFFGERGLGAKHLKKVVQDMGKRGIDCIGIGIASDAVTEFYPRAVAVWKLEDLGKHAVDQLAKVLLGDKYVVDPSTLMKGAA